MFENVKERQTAVLIKIKTAVLYIWRIASPFYNDPAASYVRLCSNRSMYGFFKYIIDNAKQ